MSTYPENTPDNRNYIQSEEGYKNPPDLTPRREGGDDALAESSPLDSRSDEKVIFNDQKSRSSGEATQSGRDS